MTIQIHEEYDADDLIAEALREINAQMQEEEAETPEHK